MSFFFFFEATQREKSLVRARGLHFERAEELRRRARKRKSGWGGGRSSPCACACVRAVWLQHRSSLSEKRLPLPLTHTVDWAAAEAVQAADLAEAADVVALREWAQANKIGLTVVGPEGPLANGGPDQSDTTKFRPFTGEDAGNMWTYHAVSAVIRGVSLLAAQPEVDQRRIGITGISWGGYLTCIVAGLDHHLNVAVPVYGCGFLGDNSAWKSSWLEKMPPDARQRWLEEFDPSRYLGQVRCPILFLNSASDFAYPLDSYRASYRLVPARLRHVSVVPGLPHGHIWTFGEVDAFVDSVLRRGVPLAHVGRMKIKGNTVSSSVKSPTPVNRAYLHYTVDTGDWQHRHWETSPAELKDGKIRCRLPAQRPLVFYLAVTDERGLRVSAEHEELAAAK